jgi:hypothetical protein
MRPRSTLRPVPLAVLILAYVAIGFFILWSNDGNHSGRVIGMAGLTYGFIAAFDAWAWPRPETDNGAGGRLLLFKPTVAFFVWAAVVAAAGVANFFEEDTGTWEPLFFFGIAVVLAVVGLWWAARGSNRRPSD